jgi:hypothetical protein
MRARLYLSPTSCTFTLSIIYIYMSLLNATDWEFSRFFHLNDPDLVHCPTRRYWSQSELSCFLFAINSLALTYHPGLIIRVIRAL